jgi:hypothetical protein
MALAGFLRWKKDKLDRVVDITIHTAFVASTITLIIKKNIHGNKILLYCMNFILYF